MSGGDAPQPVQMDMSQLRPAGKELIRKLQLVRQSENSDEPYSSRTARDRAWLLDVVEFLDAVFPDAMLELLTAPGTRMAADLTEQLQREAFPTGGSPRLHPLVAQLRLLALTGVDALTLNGWDVSAARDLVAEELTSAGVTTAIGKRTAKPGNRISRRVLEDWAEWFEAQPDAFDAGKPNVSGKSQRQMALQVITDAIDAGVDPKTAACQWLKNGVRFIGLEK